ncbi:MAG: hypothetical protein ACRD3P_12465 [Terriglobales bacterium]
MRRLTTILLSILFIAVLPGAAQSTQPTEPGTVTIVFNNGHSQSISLDDIARIELKSGPVLVFKDGRQQKLSADIARIEFPSPTKEMPFGRNRFVGKWEVGVGAFGAGHFFITLDPNGEARKTLGSSHGTWAVVDGEARINWDDGWHDAIRKIGSKYEKRAYEHGKTFSDEPSNVTDAKNTTAQPI